MQRQFLNNPSTSTLKLFPRLAPANVITSRVRVERPLSRDRMARMNSTHQKTAREHVRARLLQMILDNEQARRGGNRPNAS